MHERLVASLISLLEAGATPWRREWDGRYGGHQCNLISGRRYRGVNPALLSLGQQLRGSALPYWCGFAEAKARGLVPRRGSKAIHVLQPQQRRACAQVETESPDAQAQGIRQWITYRPVPVFNAGDLEGDALQSLIRARREAAGESVRSEPERLAGAEAVLGAWPVPVDFGGPLACYSPSSDRIQLPDRHAFHGAAALYATWAHEAIHSTGHPSRLNRDLSGGMGERAYAREELVAELGAVLLGERLEIGSAMANHAAYLASWISLLRETPGVLLTVLGDARRAAELICPEAADH